MSFGINQNGDTLIAIPFMLFAAAEASGLLRPVVTPATLIALVLCMTPRFIYRRL